LRVLGKESFFFGELAQGLKAGEGAPDDVPEAGLVALEEEVEAAVLAGEFAGSQDQALDVGGLALDGPEAVETPGDGADFLDRGLLDGVARGEEEHVLVDEFPEALAGLAFEDGGPGVRFWGRGSARRWRGRRLVEREFAWGSIPDHSVSELKKRTGGWAAMVLNPKGTMLM
jgi:hypothetical protein